MHERTRADTAVAGGGRSLYPFVNAGRCRRQTTLPQLATFTPPTLMQFQSDEMAAKCQLAQLQSPSPAHHCCIPCAHAAPVKRQEALHSLLHLLLALRQAIVAGAVGLLGVKGEAQVA